MKFPRMVRIHQRLAGSTVENIAQEVSTQLNIIYLQEKIFPGASIAINAGSR